MSCDKNLAKNRKKKLKKGDKKEHFRKKVDGDTAYEIKIKIYDISS